MTTQQASLAEIARLFLRLGTTAFGGPAAHIAMMEDEVVGRRRWLTRGEFLDYVSASQLIPGPNSTELAMHIGLARGGWPGLIVAGLAFIVPAALIVGAIAWAYVRYGTLPDLAAILYGLKPVVIAVVVQALWGLGRSALKTSGLIVLGLVAIGALALGVHELIVLAAAGLTMAAWPGSTGRASGGSARLIVGAAGSATGAAIASAKVVAQAVAAAAPVTLWSLFLSFAKIGSVLFGSGYVLIAFLRADFVERLRWLSEAQLVDAIAVGQMTPGPIFTTATFVGYLVAGPAGALTATAGIFLPAFVFVAISGPIVPRLRASPVAGRVLDGVNVASLALMTVVSWEIGRTALVDPPTLVIAGASLVLLMRYRVNSAWLVAGGGLIGWLIRQA
jgi:chromate transporter